MPTPVIAMQSTKLIITNRNALISKYGDQHQTILDGLQKIVQSDVTRHLDTKIIFLDDSTQMTTANATAVTDPTDETQVKKAIDQLYAFYTPGYIMLIGAQDIIPFQRLKNLVSGDTDPDAFIPSDLPYACDAAYDKNPGTFISPSRVVGRLPDIPAKTDPTYLLSLIQDILDYTPQDRSQYNNYFSLSSFDWQDSTQKSLLNIFGNNAALTLIPSEQADPDAAWTDEQLMPKMHFINLHGAINNPRYYGQRKTEFPPALKPETIKGKIIKGTIVAAECCYGAQLIDPSKNVFMTPGMANSYLANHAIAFLGSSNIAYGPATGQGLADLLTQFFMINVLNGASTGRALLEARQKFLHEMGPTLDPYELKTAAQFNLMGDPSMQPVINEKDPSMDDNQSFVNSVQNRRDNMEARGKMLDTFIASPEPADHPADTNDQLQKSMDSLLNNRNFQTNTHRKLFINRHKHAAVDTPSVKFHVFSEAANVDGHAPKLKVLVVKEKNNQILGYREYVSR
ncbi:C25 family cysteine peptidase [Chitinophaga sp. Hz27]|uniref:C25 family cysteine peptidase n=1 Tax=Chitinophaga sp. Hz27 TaxID=3347169 RepID=UPI0035D6AF19